MASDREYTIIIENKGGSDDGGASSVFAGNNTASSDNATAANANKKKANLKTDISAMFAYRTVKSFAVQQINHEVSLVELKTGSKDAQDHANFYNQVIQSGVSILETTAIGATTGSLPGALIGFAVSATQKVVSIINQNDTINTQRDIENRSLQQSYIRRVRNLDEQARSKAIRE